MRRTPHPLALLIIVLGMLTLMFAPSGEAANAQDNLVPVPVIIEATSETPDPQPGEPTPTNIAPEETATLEAPTEEPAPLATPTSDGEIEVPPAPSEEAPTLGPPSPTPLPTEGVIFYDDFEVDLSKWVASQDVLILLDDAGNRVASLPDGSTLQPFNFPSLSTFELAVWFSPTAAGGLNVQFGEGYTLTLASDAPATLTAVDGTTLATGETVLSAATWRQAQLLVQGDSIALAIDGVPQFAFTAETRATAGQIVLNGSGEGASVDDVSIAIPAEEEIEPTPIPSATPTPGEPVSLDMNREKLDGVLVNVLDIYATGDSGSAFGMANNYMLQVDRQSRISVTIWAAEGFSGQQVANQVQKVNGNVEVTEAKFVRARVTLEGLAALSLKEQVSVILVAERLASTDVPVGSAALNIAASLDRPMATIGDEGTEGFNIVGAQAWHQAGFTGDIVGTPIRIGVIDIGFGAAENVQNNPDLTCLNSYPNISLVTGGAVEAGDSRRGRDMVEVICDVAPNSKVRLYKVSNTSQLASAIDTAAGNNRIVVIGVDLGVNSAPGDGTLGRADVALDPYAEIIEARQDGVIVIASAGNNGNGSVAFNYAGGSTTMQIKVAPGEAINLGWNDWATNPNGGGTPEDFDAVLSGGGVNGSKPDRGTSNPGYQFPVPGGCTTDGQGLCTTTLTISGKIGNNSLIQVQATGLRSSITNLTGSTALADAGNIARPGDSPDAITVGAVCANINGNFPQLTYSSNGPVYAPGGNFTALPAAPFKGLQVKPDVVGPSQVSVRGVAVNDLTDWCTDVTIGFGGSEAAAAHVAGMAALLVNNEELTQFIGSGAQQAMRNYLRTHSADLHVGATPDGYDMAYGAGLTSLGSPTFNANNLPTSSTFITPNRLPTGQTCAGYVYVGPYDIGSINMDGTTLHPYTHPTHAIQIASATPNTCVVLLPGEYVTPWHITGLANPVKVYGYSSVVRVSAPSSRVHVQNAHVGSVGLFSKYGGVYIEDTNGIVINGFTFTTGLIAGSTTNPFNFPQVFIVDSANNARFSNNRIQNIFSRSTLIEVLNGSNNVHINGNIFRENSSDENLFGSSLISVEDSGAAGSPVQVYENTFRDNTSVQGLWIINDLPLGAGNDPVIRWVSLVKSLDSYIDITNNVFRGNQSETLIQVVTRAKGKNYTNSDTDEAPYVARILGNAIVGNTMTTEDVTIVDGAPVGLNSGPLINLWHAQKTYIVNNTIARNVFDDTNFGRLIIGRGNDSEDGSPGQLHGSLGSTQNAIEIINNFVFDNNATSLFDDTKLDTVGCRSLVSDSETDNNGARSNWLFRSGGAGACNNSINNVPGNNNITTIDPYPVDENGEPTGDPTYILGGENPTNPGFYVLSGTPANPDGVDEGANGFVQTNLPDFFAGRDVRRAARVRDGDVPTDGNAIIDIGAYETTPLSIVNPIDVPTVGEDSGVISFEFNSDTGSFIEGGVPPFSFDITRYPKFFGTHCDARFTFAARGIVIEELDSGLIIASYCPPRDFHTQSSHPSFNSDDVSFDVDVIDSSNSIVATVANYTISQINDTALDTSLTTEASVAITRGSDQNQVKLRPFVDFTSNFVFSERNNTTTGTASTEVDYDFEYTFPTRTAGSAALENAMVWENQDAGIIGFDLTAIDSELDATFEYDVEDRNGNTVTNTIVIHAVAEPGNFSLLTPQDNSIILDVEELTEFTWEFAEPVESYNFSVEREVDTDFFEPIFALADLPADGLCTATTCELPVSDALLVLLSKGRYRWNVEANNQGLLKPADEPFIFNIIGGRELLKNGSFETKGKTVKLAQYWRVPKIVTGDRRTGKAGAGNGADLHFWYRLTAQKTSTGNIKQTARPLGAPGDLLTLSAYVKTKSLQASSYIQSQITYTNGKKVNIRLNIPKGNQNSWIPLAKTIQLKGIVQKNLVTIQQSKGTGHFDVDMVSLILDQKRDFKLIGPTDNATFVATGTINTFTWDESGSAKTYNLTITDIETTTAVVTETGLTRKKDADRLTCNKDLCRYTLASSLVEGRYEWTVTASTGFTALNAPYRFDIDLAPTQLLKNPGFENGTSGNPKSPASWKRVKVGVNDARVCNVIPAAFNKPDTIRSYQGNCAFKFLGRPNAQVRLEQTMSGSAFAVDDQLVLSFVAKAAGLKANAGRVILTITYSDNTKETLKEVLPAGKYEWDSFEKVLNVSKTVKNLKLQVIHSGVSGGYTIDSISVTHLGG